MDVHYKCIIDLVVVAAFDRSNAVLILVMGLGCGRVGFVPSVDAEPADGTSPMPDRIALVQRASGWSGSRVTSRAITLAAPAMGNLLIVAVSTSFTIPISVTDSAGNMYQGVSSNPATNSPTYCNIVTYYARNVTTMDPFTVTVTTGLDDYLSMVVVEVAGTDPVAPEAASVRNAGMNALPIAGPIGAARDDVFDYAVLCHNSTRTTTMGSGYQVVEIPTEDGASNSALVTAYKLGDADPTSVDAMMSGADSWQMMLTAFE